MDLSLMTRKMKGLQYNSKEEFSNDLDLIWSNCLAYNTDPVIFFFFFFFFKSLLYFYYILFFLNSLII